MTDDAFRERVVSALDRIAHAEERVALVAELSIAPPQEDAEQQCPHPMEVRQDFGMTDGRPDWRCAACGYRSIEEVSHAG